MKRFFRRILLFILVIFAAPSLTHLTIWAVSERPVSWRTADWSSANILPPALAGSPAEVYIMAARTGGLKGAVSKHSWIVLKRKGAARYQRYDVVGWGSPVRNNAWAADARWYSNTPEIVYQATGSAAARLIPQIESAIAGYRWNKHGDYTIWPGPNSNTFVASVIRAVPDLDVRLPATAMGKDFPLPGKLVEFDFARKSLRLSLFGYAGLSLALKSGIEINLLGLVAGIDWRKPALILPGFGRIG